MIFLIPLVTQKSPRNWCCVDVSVAFFVCVWPVGERQEGSWHELNKSKVLSLKPSSVRWDLPGVSRERAEQSSGLVAPGPPVFAGGDSGLELGLAHMDLL